MSDNNNSLVLVLLILLSIAVIIIFYHLICFIKFVVKISIKIIMNEKERLKHPEVHVIQNEHQLNWVIRRLRAYVIITF